MQLPPFRAPRARAAREQGRELTLLLVVGPGSKSASASSSTPTRPSSRPPRRCSRPQSSSTCPSSRPSRTRNVRRLVLPPSLLSYARSGLSLVPPRAGDSTLTLVPVSPPKPNPHVPPTALVALGATVPLPLLDLPSHLRPDWVPLAKTKFSMLVPKVEAQLDEWGTKSVVLFGIEVRSSSASVSFARATRTDSFFNLMRAESCVRASDDARPARARDRRARPGRRRLELQPGRGRHRAQGASSVPPSLPRASHATCGERLHGSLDPDADSARPLPAAHARRRGSRHDVRVHPVPAHRCGSSPTLFFLRTLLPSRPSSPSLAKSAPLRVKPPRRATRPSQPSSRPTSPA